MEYIRPIDPETEPDRLSQNLGINGTNLAGILPAASDIGSVQITNAQSSALVSKGATLYIPFTFITQNQLKGIYLQVVGANNYWDIPFENLPQEDNYVFPVDIPDYVLIGNFQMSYALYDENNAVSYPRNLLTKVAPVEAACANGEAYHEEGSEGLTVRRIELGEEAGTINVRYQMYSLPDRLDIRYNDTWVASTAPSALATGATPPSSVCFDGTVGYVSGSAVLSFEYDPAVSKEFLIYMSGCYGATAWDFWVDCPSTSSACPVNVGFPRITPIEVTMPANQEGKFNTGILINDGDYVFVGTRGTVHLKSNGFPLSGPWGYPTGNDPIRKYANYNFGQLLIQQGGRQFPCEPIGLKGDDCEGIPDETFTQILFGGVWGDYFVARSKGVLELEINDKNHLDNEGQFQVSVHILSMNQHQFRNCFNRCPREEPGLGLALDLVDNQGNQWDQFGPFDETIEDCYHGGGEDYRGESQPVIGCQCVYSEDNEELLNSTTDLSLGTFDYGYGPDGSPQLHYILDVFPHVAYLQENGGFNYLPTPEDNLY